MRHIALAAVVVMSLLGAPGVALGDTPGVALGDTPGVALGDALGVVLTAPPEGAPVGGVVTLTAETTGAVLTVAFDVSADGASWTGVAIDASAEDGWTSSWDTTGWDGPAWVRATASDGQATVSAQTAVIVDNVAPAPTARLTNAAFSPNEDGRADRTGVEVVLDEPATLTVLIMDSRGVVRRLLDAEPTSAGAAKVRWRGRGDTVRVVADGRYLVRVEAVDAVGNLGVVQTAVMVDTRAPTFAWRRISPDPFRGIGNVRFGFRIHDRAPAIMVRGRITDAEDRAVTALAPRWIAGGLRRLTWDGHARDGGVPTPGLLRLTITLRDDAGNVWATTPEPFRDHHPVSAQIVRRVDGVSGMVALTFDDCYDTGSWARILDVLEARQAGGSFFCLGPYVRANPALARRTVAEGHTIGGHGWDHHDVRTLADDQIRTRLRLEADAWWDAARVTPIPYFRPPYGELDDGAIRAIGQEGVATIVLWDVDPWDWSRPGSTTVTGRVLAHVRDGSIVVLHAISDTARALPGLVDALRDRGLEPVTLAQLLAAGRA